MKSQKSKVKKTFTARNFHFSIFTSKFILVSAAVWASLAVCLAPLTARAQAELPDCESTAIQDRLADQTRLNVPLPGFTDEIKCQRKVPNSEEYTTQTYNVLKDRDPTTKNDDLANYLYAFYVYFVWIVGILATVMVMYGGLQWITAAGNSSRIENAKQTMNGAFIAVVLTLTSYLLLQLINPTLLRLRLPISEVTPEFAGGFCQTIGETNYAELARQKGVECGQVFAYTPAGEARPNLFCMSQWCSDPGLTCVRCRGKNDPFASCPGSGMSCAQVESRVTINGTLLNSLDRLAKKIQLYGSVIVPQTVREPNYGVTTTGEWTLKEMRLDEETSADHFLDGAKFKLESGASIALRNIYLKIEFDGRDDCQTEKFDLTYQAGNIASRTINLNAENCEITNP